MMKDIRIYLRRMVYPSNFIAASLFGVLLALAATMVVTNLPMAQDASADAEDLRATTLEIWSAQSMEEYTAKLDATITYTQEMQTENPHYHLEKQIQVLTKNRVFVETTGQDDYTPYALILDQELKEANRGFVSPQQETQNHYALYPEVQQQGLIAAGGGFVAAHLLLQVYIEMRIRRRKKQREAERMSDDS